MTSRTLPLSSAPLFPRLRASFEQATVGLRLPDAPGPALARAHERRVYLASHPALILAFDAFAWNGAVTSIPRLGHFVSDATIANEVFGDPARFSKLGAGGLEAFTTAVLGPNALFNMEGEAHRQLRGRLQGLFTTRVVGDLVAQIFDRPAREARDRLARGETLDLVRLTQVLTGSMVCVLAGIELPEGREEETAMTFFRLGIELASIGSITRRAPTEAQFDFAKERFATLTRHTRAAYDRGDESTVPGRMRSLGLDFEESRGVIGALFVAGMETTAAALPRIVAMLVDSGAYAELRRDPGLMKRAVDEGIRLTSPVPLSVRSVVADTTLGGKPLRRDERVVVLLYNLLKGDDFGRHPLDLDLHRELTKGLSTLSFGHGAHFCIGASLARREIESVLQMLLDAGDLTIESRRYGRKVLFPAYDSLHVRLADGARA